jgi:hypothetical protein
MLFNRKSTKFRKRQSAWLYSAVFTGRFSMLLVFLLLISFTIQPFHKAIASETAPEVIPETPVVAEDVAPQIEEILEEPPPLPETTQATTTVDTFSEEAIDPPIDPPPEEDIPLPEEEPEVFEEAEPPVSNDEATSTPSEPSVVNIQNIVTEDNFYQFSKQSCIAVGDGAYHCSSNTTDEIGLQSVASAKQGESGNMEIFLQTSKNKERQITSNQFDDTAPHYDPESMRVVWHRLIDGRYQIVLYDIMEDNESQLTFSKTNNMEPKVSDAGIVWQAWDGNDWEIMFFDGSYTEQLTNNDSQDVAPVIQDGYVLWNVLGSDEQQARVYSLDTKETISIEGYEGGAIANPRFVLVYDTQFENGDVVTQSFDPTTGLSEPIAAKAAPEPINIPESDPTGEIRALLLQGKNQKEDSELFDLDQDDPQLPNIATSTPGTLNLSVPSDTAQDVVMQLQSPDVPAFELTEYDLVISESALNDALSHTQ